MFSLSTHVTRRIPIVMTVLMACGVMMGVDSPVAAADNTVSSANTGPLYAYVVNAVGTGVLNQNQMERAIVRAGGVVVQGWPEIGVTIVSSTNTAFPSNLRKTARRLLASVGTTRTTALSAPGIVDSSGLTGAVVPDPGEVAQWGNTLIKAPEAHQITDGDPGVTIGIMDSGVTAILELKGKLDTDRSVDCSAAGGRPVTGAGAWMDSLGHGTAVASVAAARRDGFAMVGVAPAVRVASLKVGDDTGNIYPEYAICGVMWAGRTGLPIANMSFAVDPWLIYCDSDPDQAAVKLALGRAVQWAQRRGVAFVAAAGNDAFDLAVKGAYDRSPTNAPTLRQLDPSCKQLPTELPGVVVVGGVEQSPAGTPQMYFRSNRGLGVINVTAPAAQVYAATPTGGYAFFSGTSFAAPHAAGVLALMKSTHPKATTTNLLSRLYAQADPMACPVPVEDAVPRCIGPDADNSYFGHGVVNALDAVQIP